MYCEVDFKTKKALEEAVKSGRKIGIFAPGIGISIPKDNWTEYIEGPHSHKPHTWYAMVKMKDGFIVEVK